MGNDCCIDASVRVVFFQVLFQVLFQVFFQVFRWG